MTERSLEATAVSTAIRIQGNGCTAYTGMRSTSGDRLQLDESPVPADASRTVVRRFRVGHVGRASHCGRSGRHTRDGRTGGRSRIAGLIERIGGCGVALMGCVSR